MATEVLMPRQGQSVESCLIVGWKKKEGDAVAEGDVLCEVETDKATFEVEAPASGVLLSILFKADEEVPVLTPIAYIGEAGENVAAAAVPSTGQPSRPAAPDAQPQTTASHPATPEPDVSARTTSSSTGGSFISPRARRLAENRGIAWDGLGGSGPGGRIIERDVEQAIKSGVPMTAAAAGAGGIAPDHGSGIGGRVRVSDLRAPDTDAGTTGMPGLPLFPGPFAETPVKGVRKVIAERMLASLQTTAQLTMNASADARGLQALRARFKASDEALGLRAVTINDLVHFAVARTLPRFAYMNAHLSDAMLREFSHVHLGFAVDTPRGLMVPTVRFADQLSLRAMAAEAKRLAAVCQGGSAGPDDLATGTFTVTNLGGLGVESFTPVLNPPQVAILGVSNIGLKPVQNGEQIDFVPSIGLSLTIDHRAVDGAPAARFLQALSSAIADIDLILAL